MLEVQLKFASRSKSKPKIILLLGLLAQLLPILTQTHLPRWLTSHLFEPTSLFQDLHLLILPYESVRFLYQTPLLLYKLTTIPTSRIWRPNQSWPLRSLGPSSRSGSDDWLWPEFPPLPSTIFLLILFYHRWLGRVFESWSNDFGDIRSRPRFLDFRGRYIRIGQT